MTDKQDQFWDIISEATNCMVTTNDEGVLRSRPMAAYVNKGHKVIRFLTDRGAAKVEELHHDRDVNVSFVNNDDHRYASVSGRASVTTDRSLVKELWGPAAEIWFEGDADTADVAVITVVPEQAEYWDADSGKIKAAYELTKAYFTDETPDIGENAKLDQV